MTGTEITGPNYRRDRLGASDTTDEDGSILEPDFPVRSRYAEVVDMIVPLPRADFRPVRRPGDEGGAVFA